MSNITYYHLRITPNGPYFFGQEAIRIFGNKQPYFRKSRALPSQTTLFGMIRRMLCTQNGLSRWSDRDIPKENRERAKELIGEFSFEPDRTSYGIITYLGPLSLWSKDQTYHPAHYCTSTNLEEPVSLGKETDLQYIDVLGTNEIMRCGPVVNFKAKLDFKQAYYGIESNRFWDEPNFLCRQTLTHTSKSKSGQSERTAYFMDEVIVYNPDVELQCFVGLIDTPGLKFKSGSAVLGGDQRRCNVYVQPVGDTLPPDHQYQKLEDIKEPALLLSDCFPKDGHQSMASLVFSSGHRMTYLTTSVNTNSFALATRNPIQDNAPGFAKPVHVLNAGGVIWPAKGKSFSDILSHPNARVAGFNYVLPIKLTQ